jgi:hypothetical protein
MVAICKRIVQVLASQSSAVSPTFAATAGREIATPRLVGNFSQIERDEACSMSVTPR